MAFEEVSETFTPVNSGGYDDSGNYYSPSDAYVTNSIFLDEVNFEAFDAKAIAAFISSLSSVTSVTLTSSLYNSDALQDQNIGIAPLFYNNAGYQDTVLSDVGNDGAGDSKGAYNYQDLQDEAGAQLGTITNLSLDGGTTDTSVNVYSIVQSAAAASRDLIVAYVNNSANYGLTGVSSASITVTGYVPYDLPVITGTQSNQVVALGSTFEPFSTVLVSDPGNPTGAGDSAAIQIELPTVVGPIPTDFQGMLSFETGYTPFGQFQSIENGDYELSGEASIADLQSDLRHLMFTPEYGGSAVQLDLQVQSASGGATDNDDTTFLIVGQGGEPPCFVPGTRIATARGETAVEHLRIGDEIRTLHAGLQAVRWIGIRRYAAPFCNHARILPVTIRAGAIADGIPIRDLTVSPGHALCIDGALIHAARLVNGVGIVQAEAVDGVTYYHVELGTHEVLFAEGCPAESFAGEYFRSAFSNAAEYRRLYPGGAAPEHLCLPQLVSGFQLEAIRQRLAARAGIATPAATGPLRGFIDRLDDAVVSGWAQAAATPDVPVCLDILADGIRIGRVLANLYRADVAAAGHGAGHHGFEFAIPAGTTSAITVRRSSDGAVLATAGGLRQAA